MGKHFFIIGAQRSATTYLYNLLAEHPEIEMAQPLKPEPKFFLQDVLYGKGLAYYETHYFSGKVGAWLQGEKSTSYLEYSHVAQRLAINYPEARILIIMRDPIERALSNYWFSHNHGIEKWPIEKAFFAQPNERVADVPEKVSVNPFAYLQRGRYIDYIAAYNYSFPPEQIYGMLTEQMLGDLAQVQAIYAYLEVASDFQPTGLHKQVNDSQPGGQTLSSKLRYTLIDYFSEANGRLADQFGFDLKQWWPSCQ